jgi:hypothetical protein
MYYGKSVCRALEFLLQNIYYRLFIYYRTFTIESHYVEGFSRKTNSRMSVPSYVYYRKSACRRLMGNGAIQRAFFCLSNNTCRGVPMSGGATNACPWRIESFPLDDLFFWGGGGRL